VLLELALLQNLDAKCQMVAGTDGLDAPYRTEVFTNSPVLLLSQI
jgi:hypothetical protein